MNAPLNPFAHAAQKVVGEALEITPDLFPVSAPPNPTLGDFAVGCFPAAKQLKKAPPALAAQVVDAFAPNEFLTEAKAAGPFVNFKANRESLFRHLFSNALSESRECVPKHVGQGKTICIDYSSPNISKHLAYHHIRSTVIGHSLAELYRALGYNVVGINHLGDWGTTHGMLLAAAEKWGVPEPLNIDALNALYVKFRAAMKEDDSLAELGRAWFKKLEDGDTEARTLWEKFRDISLAEFESVYEVLGIRFEEVRGESAYEAAIPGVLKMLDDKQLSSISDGALVVDLEAEGMPPLLLRKQDGATLYATRDVAAAMYRWETYSFERSLYVVDRGQSLHFKQLFKTLEKIGFDWADKCKHVPFGLVRIGGKKTGTRAGNVVLLKAVLEEAENLCKARIKEANPEMAEGDLDKLARIVGVGAVVFAQLGSQREKDVDFSWDDVLSWDGDAGPYVQYGHARCSSIVAKANGVKGSPKTDPGPLSHDLEWNLAKQLADFPDVVHRAAKAFEPHHVCRYLLDTCAAFSRWYTGGNQDASLRVLTDDPKTTEARVALVQTTREILRQGLALVGCEAPDKM